jgi:HK97 family phage major capsid protein
VGAELYDKLRATLREKRTEEATARKDANEFRDGAVKEHGVDALVEKRDLREPIEERYRKADQLRQECSELEQSLDAMGVGDGGSGNPLKDEKHEGDFRSEKSYGEQFIGSDAYKGLIEAGIGRMKGLPINTPAVELGSKEDLSAMLRGEAKTLVTGAGDTSGGATFRNQRLPGILELLRETPRVVNLPASAQTDSDVVEWVRMDARTNAAAPVAEATATSGSSGTKPESGFTLEVVSTPVTEIAHWIPVTERALADAPQVRSLIDNELRTGILDTLEQQIISGNGTPPNLRGVINTVGIETQPIGSDTLLEAIFHAIVKVRLNFLEPDAIAINPSDFADIRLLRDDSGGAGTGGYLFGPPSQVGANTLWGLPLVLSTYVPAGDPIVADWDRASTLYTREGIQIAATNSHSDFFIRNMVAVRAAARYAFTVQRPDGVCQVITT